MIENTVKVTIAESEVIAKADNNNLGLLMATEWKRLIDPYTPRDTGTLELTAQIRPFEIHYVQPYARRVYYGDDMNFQKINPYSTYRWDTAAAKAGQLDKLRQTINAAIKSGRV